MKSVIPFLSLAIVPTLTIPVATFAQDRENIREIIVIGVQDTHTIVTDDTLIAPADTAQMLRMMPGANINKNGELTGIAQYRGMYGDRIKVSVDGAQVSGAGPNSMDAPLSYAPVALLESLTINRGIAPVSAGQETIGGFVQAKTYSGEFTNSNDFSFNGRTYFGAQSVNEGTVASGFFSLANRNHIFRGFVMNESADDLDFPGGTILSEYERERFDLGYGYKQGDSEFSIDVARNNTGDAGTASLPMDILSIDSDLFRSRYNWTRGDYSLTAELFGSDNSHWMSNFHLRRPPQNATTMADDPMRFRQTYAVSDNVGFALKLEQFVLNGSWMYGIDGHFTDHDAEITNPNAAPFYIDNFNGSTRDVLGIFTERSLSLSDNIGLDAGVRFNRVSTDTGNVSANLNPMNMAMGMPVMMNNMAAMLANQFNSQDLSQQDNNFDWFARLSIQADNDLTWYVGAARKMRSASYQERYLWIPMEATGGLADGKTYIGTPDLDAEVAHEIELGFDLEGGKFNVYPRLFYKEVSDYIQGTPTTNATANQFSMMMANMGMGLPNPLQFMNTEANFYGGDVEADYAVSDRVTLRAVASIVRGERDDVNDDLYRVAPDNLILALDYKGNNWMASLESINYADQDRVSVTNIEQKTDGYSIVNLSALINVTDSAELRIGVENMLDEEYLDHLAGYNRAFNPDIPARSRMPGMGRNFYGRFMWYF